MGTLRGEWLLAHDPRNEGREKSFYAAPPAGARPAPVPGVVQQVYPRSHGVFWYYHRFGLAAKPGPGRRVLLRFGAVDYLADVWVNGAHVGGHEGGETPFELDVTATVTAGGENLLAVRVLNPCSTPIDGYTLAEIPHRNKADHAEYRPGQSYNSGGIVLPVTLEIAPAIRITDLCARPEIESGRVHVRVTVLNGSGRPARARLTAIVAPGVGSGLDTAAAETAVPAGESAHDLLLAVHQPRVWDLDDPFLYRVTVNLEPAGAGPALKHDLSTRCGFRDFRVVDGFFHLNGRRVLLKSTHTGNHFPVGVIVPPCPELMRRDLLMAKDGGYNMVRFIAGMAYPEQLDFCDEIGLMVYEENLAGWLLGDSPQMAERFDRSVREMVLRDRNHPSVAVWGMLNETVDGPVFRQAVKALDLVRELDPTRLVLLDSGRWDGQWSIGSVSNPGSTSWEPVWGKEGPAVAAVPVELGWDPGGYVRDAGDAHVYPLLPQSPEHTRLLRTLGADAKPVFLSEYGIGSQFNAIDEGRRYEQAGANPDLADFALVRGEAERFTADLVRFGLDGVYPFPEDFLRESYAHSIRQRRAAFDVIRSNPRICGYNLTGMLDHGMTGEGVWTFWRDWKPGAAECLRDGWAPLRWCLFVDPLHGYAGRPVRVEAVLANEDVLPAGEYPARFRLFSPATGLVWEQLATVRIPDSRPLAVPVLDETLELGLPAGEYVLATYLEANNAPKGDRLRFRISDPVQPAAEPASLTLLGIAPAVETWLAASEFTCLPFAAGGPDASSSLLLVGDPEPAGAELWSTVDTYARFGGTVLFLSAKPFRIDAALPPGGGPSQKHLPLGEDVTAREFHDWLYHKDILAKPHRVFEGLPTGLLGWDDYGQVCGHAIFDCRRAPDDAAAAAFALGYCCPGGYDSGVVVAALTRGKGRVILNSTDLLDWVGRHPAADRLLLNLIGWGRLGTEGAAGGDRARAER